MSNHSPYIFTPATGKMRRDGIIRNIVRFFASFHRSQEPQGRGRIVPGFPPQMSNGSGYHAPCYPPNMKPMEPAPIERGYATWNHEMAVRPDAQQSMDSF